MALTHTAHICTFLALTHMSKWVENKLPDKLNKGLGGGESTMHAVHSTRNGYIFMC